jgi:hypothetical protein
LVRLKSAGKGGSRWFAEFGVVRERWRNLYVILLPVLFLNMENKS